jgi:hypothetical protein
LQESIVPYPVGDLLPYYRGMSYLTNLILQVANERELVCLICSMDKAQAEAGGVCGAKCSKHCNFSPRRLVNVCSSLGSGSSSL